MSNYHGRIMNVMSDGATLNWANTREAYMYGHRDARHAAAEIAAEADATVAQLVEALEDARLWVLAFAHSDGASKLKVVRASPRMAMIEAALKAAKGEA